MQTRHLAFVGLFWLLNDDLLRSAARTSCTGHWCLLTLHTTCNSYHQLTTRHNTLWNTNQPTLTIDSHPPEFLSECSFVKCFFSQRSKPNELIYFNTMLYDSVCLGSNLNGLKGPHGELIRFLARNVMILKIVTSHVQRQSSHVTSSVTSPIDAP